MGGQAGCRAFVLPQGQPVFAAAGHDAVRFIRALGDQVVDEDADIGFRTGQDERILPLYLQGRVDAGHEALGSRFFVAAGAVGLACREEAGNLLRFQPWCELCRVQAVVFDGVTRTHDFDIFQARNGPQEGVLYVSGHAGAHALDVHFFRRFTFRFDEQLMPLLIGKADDLRFDGRAVTRADAGDDAVTHRRPIEVVADDLMRFFIGESQPAAFFVAVLAFRQERKGMPVFIAFLFGHFVRPQGAAVDAGRRPVLKSHELEARLRGATPTGLRPSVADGAAGNRCRCR